MNIKEAIEVTGGLSSPSKMPGLSYNLPAQECKVGSRLRQVKNSTCSTCYAFKGRYRFTNVKNALYRRLDAVKDPRWIDSMSYLINRKSKDWFRWHDSGDLQSLIHLRDIVKVAENTPETWHWLPTREYSLVGNYLALGGEIPPNLTIRLSGHQINGNLGLGLGLPVSSVRTQDFKGYEDAYNCPAQNQGNVCGNCRACWNPEVKHVSYLKH